MPEKMKNLADLSIVIKGAGEMASGIAHRLYQSGLKQILMLEIEKPLSVRRFVSFCEAVYDGSAIVEDVAAKLVSTVKEVGEVWKDGKIAVIIDPSWTAIDELSPDVLIDAIMAKRNLGTKKSEAPFVIGVGPDFVAPRDVHVVVESNRGHDLGRVMFNGTAEPYTGKPGEMKGVGMERVLRAPRAGMVRHVLSIGDEVKKGELILYVSDEPVYAPFDGILRGLIRQIDVEASEKVGDVDPRAKKDYCYTISDKARAIGGGVLEAILNEHNPTGQR